MEDAKKAALTGEEPRKVDMDDMEVAKKNPRTFRKWFCWTWSNHIVLSLWLLMWYLVFKDYCEDSFKLPECGGHNTYEEAGFCKSCLESLADKNCLACSG